MGAGIEIYNHAGVLQITGKYKNLMYLGKGTVHKAASGLITYAEFQTNVKELIAIREDSGHWIFPAWRDTSGLMRIYGDRWSTFDVTYYRFGYDDWPVGRHFEVRNENNDIVFSDAGNPMKVIGSSNGYYDGFNEDEGAVISRNSHPTTTKAAVIVGKRCLDGTTDALGFQQNFFFLPDRVETRNTVFSPDLGTGQVDLSYAYIVVDVTNY